MFNTMYQIIDHRTISYPDVCVRWPIYLRDLDKQCIHYLEIGSLHGGSLLMFHNLFGPNVHSTSIDPFSTCDSYCEYVNEHERNYEIYKINTEQLGDKNTHIRKPSYEILPLLQNNFYDVIYIDGNHNLSSILEDAVLCYRKLKPNGYLIMDDVDWGDGEKNTKNTVYNFVNAYTKDKMQLLYLDSHLILRKN